MSTIYFTGLKGAVDLTGQEYEFVTVSSETWAFADEDAEGAIGVVHQGRGTGDYSSVAVGETKIKLLGSVATGQRISISGSSSGTIGVGAIANAAVTQKIVGIALQSGDSGDIVDAYIWIGASMSGTA